MDDVIEVLWNACGKFGIAPTVPFSSVRDFEAHVVQTWPVFGADAKTEQLRLVLLAIEEAQGHRERGAVECLKQIRDLIRRG